MNHSNTIYKYSERYYKTIKDKNSSNYLLYTLYLGKWAQIGTWTQADLDNKIFNEKDRDGKLVRTIIKLGGKTVCLDCQ